VIRADHRAVEEAPHALDRVGVNLAVDPLVPVVIDRAVNGVRVADADVGLILVRVDGLSVRGYHVGQEALDRLSAGVRCDAEPDLAAALDGAEHYGLAVTPTAVAARL